MEALNKYLLVALAFFTNFATIRGQQGFPDCNATTVTWHPHPDTCTKFILCYHGNALERSCAPGLHFSRQFLKCMHPQLALCDFSSECPDTDDPFDPVFIANPNDCTRFFVCFRREAIPRQCAEGLWWDVVHKWCNVADDVTCDSRTPNNPNPGTTITPPTASTTTPTTTTTTTTTSTTTTAPTTTTRMITRYDCPLVSGTSLHPHPTNCQFFFECINGVSFLRQCPRGEHFDIVTRSCRDEASAVCVQGFTRSPFN